MVCLLGIKVINRSNAKTEKKNVVGTQPKPQLPNISNRQQANASPRSRGRSFSGNSGKLNMHSTCACDSAKYKQPAASAL